MAEISILHRAEERERTSRIEERKHTGTQITPGRRRRRGRRKKRNTRRRLMVSSEKETHRGTRGRQAGRQTGSRRL